MGVQTREHRSGVFSLTIDVASVAAATSAEQTFTLRGLRLGDFVMVSKPSLTAGLAIGSARVSAADTIAIQFINATAGALDPASETYLVHWFRPEVQGVTAVTD